MNPIETDFKSNSACEEHEMAVSALLDGELDRDSMLETIDLMLADRELQRFYREGRKLQQQFAWNENLSVAKEPLPPRLWKKIEQKSTPVEPRIFGMTPVTYRWLAAASIIIALTYSIGQIQWTELILRLSHSSQPSTVEIELGEGNANMTDGRFVEMTTELLKSDKRYHRKMLEVLQKVTTPIPNSEQTNINERSHIDKESGKKVSSQLNEFPVTVTSL